MQNDDATPVAARREPTQLDAAKLQTDANLHVQVGPATRRFHFWQQAPAWLLGFAAIGLGFLMVLRSYDSPAGSPAPATRRGPSRSPSCRTAISSRTAAPVSPRASCCTGPSSAGAKEGSIRAAGATGRRAASPSSRGSGAARPSFSSLRT